jgi:hypothetical protein
MRRCSHTLPLLLGLLHFFPSRPNIDGHHFVSSHLMHVAIIPFHQMLGEPVARRIVGIALFSFFPDFAFRPKQLAAERSVDSPERWRSRSVWTEGIPPPWEWRHSPVRSGAVGCAVLDEGAILAASPLLTERFGSVLRKRPDPSNRKPSPSKGYNCPTSRSSSFERAADARSVPSKRADLCRVESTPARPGL